MVDRYLPAALEKQQILSKIYESAYNKSGSKVNVNQSRHLFVCSDELVNGDSLHTFWNKKMDIQFPVS
jgi:hypothetical protein